LKNLRRDILGRVFGSIDIFDWQGGV